MHVRKSLLFTHNNSWIKKKGNPNFDVTMGSFDGAEICELVGLFILNKLSNLYGLETCGLYRDDGLCCFRNISGPESDRLRKEFTKYFKDEFQLKITIETNLKSVNFLDITFDLNRKCYQPYSKPNNQPIYVNTRSNHPPNIIKYIPSMISNRISKISSNKEIFDQSAPYYNQALKSSGYKEKITYSSNPNDKKRTRKRQIIWFNPPFSMNVKTNVAKKFLSIVERCFPQNHKFRKIFNRNNLKVSYSCLPNMASIISAHNKKILSETEKSSNERKTCNCRNKNICPLDGSCLIESVIYKCHVTKSENDEGKHYIGLTGGKFKDRWASHNFSFRHEKASRSTELSKYVWELKNKGIEPKLSWTIIDRASSYRNGSKTCNLCLTEKYHIITSKLNLLNKRSELISKCRHLNKFILCNYKSVPPD